MPRFAQKPPGVPAGRRTKIVGAHAEMAHYVLEPEGGFAVERTQKQ